MALDRKLIRDDVRAILIAAATPAGNRVYGFRSEPLPEEKLPGIAVLTPGETGENIALSGLPELRKRLTILIAVRVKDTGDEAMAASLDAVCEAVENALLKNADFVGQFEQILRLDTALATDPDGAVVPGAADITLEAQYVGAYEPLYDDAFLKIHADWDIPPHGGFTEVPLAPGEADAVDEVDLPQ